MGRLSAVVYIGSDNVYRYNVFNDDVAYLFSNVDYISVEIDSVIINSSTGEGTVEFTNNELSIRFGDWVLPTGKYYPEIRIYTPAYPLGWVIIGKGFPAEILLTING